MGSYAKDWSLDAKQVLVDAFNQYPLSKSMGLASQIDFVELNYNDIFEEIRALWKADAAQAAGALAAVGLAQSAANRLVELADAGTRDDFLRTHALDVVMYRFMKQISERAANSVRLQVLTRLQAFPENDRPSWSILAHSLGTSVVNDALHAMFTQTADGSVLGDRMKPDFVFMVANVAKLLWNKGGDFYSSVVRPHTVDSLGVCWKYCNFSHELDPFPRVDEFDPPQRWFPEGTTPAQRPIFLSDGPPIPARDVRDVNVHGLTHYLSHPFVNSEIINTLAGFTVVTAADVRAALQKWREDSLTGDPLKTIKDLMESNTATPSNWKKIIDMLFNIRAAVARTSKLKDGED
jgi:hypothetical protein